MAITVANLANTIASIWSSDMNVAFVDRSVWVALTSKRWEKPPMSKGDTVNIITRPTVSLSAYTAGTDLTPQAWAPSKTPLQADQDYGAIVAYDSVAEAQSAINSLDSELRDAMADAISVQMDGHVRDEYSNATTAIDASSFGGGATAISLSADNVLDVLDLMSVTLSDYKCPNSQRALVVPPQVSTMISNALLNKNATPPDIASQALKEAWIIRYGRFDIFESTIYPTSGTDKFLVGFHQAAMAWAGNFTTMAASEEPKQFTGLVKGRCVYGVLTLNANYMVTAKVTY